MAAMTDDGMVLGCVPACCVGYTRPMLRVSMAVFFSVLSGLNTQAQFTLQTSGTGASLRGIANVDGTVAWASGSSGTVLRTVDGGAHWTRCVTPAGAAQLDFRGVQAFDAQTALVMSSGKGDLSRVYKTTDGCATWKLVLTNPDAPEGFFDALRFTRRDEGWVLGDAVNGHFYLAATQDGGETWLQSKADGLGSTAAQGAFAASNQSLTLTTSGPVFGGGGGHLFRGVWPQCSQSTSYNDPGQCLDRIWFYHSRLSVGTEAASAGIFAIAVHGDTMVAVGGDYAKPSDATRVAAYSADEGVTWASSTWGPHGYRSSVDYDSHVRMWIAVGPGGTDVSTDDGHNWTPFRPDPSKGDAPDADRGWNALSLPFAVGSKGQIGRLRKQALTGSIGNDENMKGSS